MRTPRALLSWQKFCRHSIYARATSDPTGERAILMSKTLTPPRPEKFGADKFFFE